MVNLKPNYNLRNILFLLFLPMLLFGGKIVAQSTGSLFMLKDNFRANMLNPSYSRNDNVVVVALPLFAGASLGNSGSFKISDLVIEDNSGKMSMDLDNFFSNSKVRKISLFNWVSVPWVYISAPLKDGRITFYMKEQILSSLHFDLNALEFFNNGNVPVNFKSYNSDNISFSAMGYRELAVGYSKPFNKNLDIGIRGKILFGAVNANVDNWKYGIYTAENDESVLLTNQGSGKLSVPIALVMDERNRVKEVDPENMLQKYIGTFKNPGIAFDLGATYFIDEKSWMSASLNDLGAFLFRENTYKIEQNTSYNFTGLDLSNSIDSKRGGDYINPSNLNYEIKDSMRHVFRPKVDSSSFIQALIPKLNLHYQYNVNTFFSVGASNQTAFYKNAVLNIFTLSAMQKKGGLSVFENINAYGFNSLTFGAGFQYEGQFGQIFAVADNLFAVYHPAKNESYSFTLGMSLLFNKPKKDKKTNGNFDPYLPFYDNKN